ncbi:hypothetical protein [Winogradskyella sp. A3E31]|uniref:hypothetical protein n=1 Tax=Winogradskyella sp. A3E31 TaxID=3349637 RepID=UPI00398BB92C
MKNILIPTRRPYKTVIVVIIMIFIFSNVKAQNTNERGNVYIDEQGVMRWEKSEAEVHGFGVNYSVPFAHAYRTAKRLGIDPKRAIDNDIYHFTRLGFDLYRLHVWDTQISDVEGNLLENEYLDTFDYLLSKLNENSINYVITPIAFWGNGWPEPDTPTPGFSHKYGKGECLTNPKAIKAQQNYLSQFLNHVNPYTGVAYKNEPNVIAFEVSNEPHHRGEASKVTAFVKGMIDAMRKTGTQKPIFYNMSHAVHFAEAYFEGGADGGTFQWYPTGLGYQKELSGNLLPNVNDYNIPFESVFKKHNGAKLVYEFDAADVGKSYIYPAMARSFREAGIQIATHFAYDPTYMADVNTEYNTHYMNLAYTPQKALSLKICGEVFRETPMYSDFGFYPNNKTFGDFKIDYESDLAEYNTETKFFYTNSTPSKPKDQSKLTEIAGFGNSVLVSYNGLGAYFIDKIEEGFWRLEVMPDAVWVDNPFGRNSPKKTVGVIKWKTHNMTIKLDELGSSFDIKGINSGNDISIKTSNGSFKISPGTYILSAAGDQKSLSPNESFKGYHLKSFFAPKTTVDKPYFTHSPLKEVSIGNSLKIEVQFISQEEVESIEVVGYLGRERFSLKMNEVKPYTYEALVENRLLSRGYLNYTILVNLGKYKAISYPANKEGKPFDWDFYDRQTYQVSVVDPSYPIQLFNAKTDYEDLVISWRQGNKLVPIKDFNQAEFQIHLEKLFYPDNENPNAEPIYDYTFKHFIIEEISNRKQDLIDKEFLFIKGRSLKEASKQLQVTLILKDGSAFGGEIELQKDMDNYSIALSDLKEVKTVTLPRPYPSFLPYFFEHKNNSSFDINTIESIQISIKPEPNAMDKNQSVALGIVSIWLE